MKNIFLYSAALLFFFQQSHAQISILSADLTHANDTFRVSTAQNTSLIDVALTGPGYTWDYSQLEPAAQNVDSFIDESATNTLFSIVFIDNQFNSNRANQATPAPGFNLGTFISLSGVYNFYYNGSATYKQVGLGASVNGVPLPIAFSPHDAIYKLPLQFADADTSDSGYSIDLTSTLGIYYKVKKNRDNVVDGWGSLTTPFGTFDVLRVHSTVVERDSIYLDTFGFGINLPPVTTHEYKWLGAGQGIPILQVNTTAAGGMQITYKDSIRSLVGIETPDLVQNSLMVFPNPATTQTFISYEISKPSSVSLELISMDGKKIMGIETGTSLPGKHQIVLDLKEKKIVPGIYFMRLLVNGKSYLQALVVSAAKG